ncbi:alpha-amylase family glycosyl hydrolase [uncultured Winogradskyella sp.]|uniref:alpha-amylase family glycosyl hydrolase n=1 Tax=uncultured Winogradskyella sp. TaxID=395353 RepID=UPI00261EBE11|nr:alpha-amylase family glycosyl hydrolase [uncultured Winogradskyella sp.]
MKKLSIVLVLAILFVSCKNQSEDANSREVAQTEEISQDIFPWEAANIYFLLTDRFNNADTSNDVNYGRQDDAAVLRGFKGGDLKGVTQKINEGYFTDLGINAIWMTPIVEQIHGGTDEGTGKSYGFHGYWTKDWTAIDANLGTRQDLQELVDAAHSKGIRVLLDAVINHTGPVTEKDPVWPSDWVRTEPQCEYTNYENTITCTLVKNLPDIKTESNKNVDLPPQLITKWKAEGRYEEEVKELDEFFKRTGHPRAPRFYIMKWLTDYISDFGIDGYRVDTVKHTEEFVWQEFRKECDYAFNQYKKNNAEKALDDTNFYLVGEVYNYSISNGKDFNMGDKTMNYFDNAFDALINFEIKWNAKQMPVKNVFEKYNNALNGELKGHSVLNYMSSHDDGQPFDKERKMPYKTATMLLLTQGASQVYYGDEVARELIVEGATGDANLRSLMDWDTTKNNPETQKLLMHWQKLGQFRAKHPAVGAGVHHLISEDNGLVFSRVRDEDKIIVGIELPKGKKSINVSSIFKDGLMLRDEYSGKIVNVVNGNAEIDSDYDIVLLEKFIVTA